MYLRNRGESIYIDSITVINWFKFQRLKAAVHYTVGRICEKLGEEHRREFSRQVIAAITETAVRQCGESQVKFICYLKN